MPLTSDSYEYIANKIKIMKDTYPSLRDKSDDYVFSALCVKASFYKNPAIILNESDYAEFVVDGQYDGGADILLSDPNSEAADLIIGQSKYHKSLTNEDVLNAMLKMTLFYKDMIRGNYDYVCEKVQRRFLTLYSEIGEESKIRFVFYTSAPQKGISRDRIEKKFREQFTDATQIEVSILFSSDIEEEIKESESRRPTVESGRIHIDQTNNFLEYGRNAAIVNVSAFSIKQLYAQYNTNLLSRNLRYHIPGIDIDKGIAKTISETPELFWMKNNGITIVCDDFRIDGREVKLRNFSIVNGGQTTYMIHKSKAINESNDLFLPCKIIKNEGNTEDEKNLFSLEIAKATNSQKAIKRVDLKANSPEQVRFVQAMREVGIYYQTKRGETVPPAFRVPYLNTDLVEVGKLCMAGIFQIPCTSRQKPSTLYQEKYYEPIFNGNQLQTAKICKELLYIDYYFRTKFQRNYDRAASNTPNSNIRISFAHNDRTICIAFVMLASRYQQGNIGNQELEILFNAARSESVSDSLYEIFRKLGNMQYIFPPQIQRDKNIYDINLDKLFYAIINEGVKCFSMASNYDSSLTATNFLKKDKNYYNILSINWVTLQSEISRIFSEFL